MKSTSAWEPKLVTAFMQEYATVIANVFAERMGVAENMHFQPLKTDAGRLVGILSAGKAAMVVKHYGDDDTGFRREVQALGNLASSGVVPKVYFADIDRRLVMMQRVPGKTLGKTLNPSNVLAQCRALGAAIRAANDTSVRLHTTDTWAEYLGRVPRTANSLVLEGQHGLLQQLAIRHLTLAGNDGGLDNVIVRPDGRAVLIDFHRARMKPLGWDVFMAATTLARVFPGHCSRIADGLADGYWPGNEGQAARFAAVAKVFMLALTFEPAAADAAGNA
ncbi:MAG: aminoglycoside phosphotransferase family protein [Pseudomonadota bacterium]